MSEQILYVAIGPSGSGKSTVFNKLKEKNPDLALFSWDALRLEWYDDGSGDYSKAWEKSCKDRKFQEKASAVLAQLIVEGKSIYIDNTNLTVKRRRPYIEAAKACGYTTIGITFDVDLKTLIARQTTRGDKYVNEGAVKQQFNSLQSPVWKEFDKVYESTRIV